jgi:nicotinate-nucleotide pyrophosphorylase (carboxylating)
VTNPDLKTQIREDVRSVLAEDIGSGDLSAVLVPETQRARARVLLRHGAVICGQSWFNEVFHQLDATIDVTWLVEEGEFAHADTYLCEVTGAARPILSGERSALNFLQTLSATATAAREFSSAVADTSTTILDTRKTLPGLRLAQKYAARMGGASNHRLGLYDAIMIKENHIIASGGIKESVAAAKGNSPDVMIVVEVETLDETKQALQTPVQRLLLDDFSLSDMREAVQLRNTMAPDIRLEASGGVTIESVQDIAATGVDFISVGSITKHIRATDLSMRFEFVDK